MFQSRHSILFAGLFGLIVGSMHHSAHARPNWLRTSITPTPNQVYVLVKAKRRAFVRIHSNQRSLRASLWVRRATGWKQLHKHYMQRRKWTHAVSTRRICRASFGQTQIALQLAVRSRAWWWNRFRRTWQRNYISVHQVLYSVRCPNRVQDYPPGSPHIYTRGHQPPVSDPFGGRVPPHIPGATGHPHQPAAPAQPHSGHGHPGQPHHPPTPPAPPAQPSQPPPPPVVSRGAYRSFMISLQRSRFSSSKRTMVRSWSNRLGERRLHARQIGEIIAQFTFSSDKIKAARILRRNVLRPVSARGVRSIIRSFKSDSSKLKAALMYCRHLSDPLHVHRIASAFTFSSSKRKILRLCK